MRTINRLLIVCLLLSLPQSIQGDWTPKSRFWEHIRDQQALYIFDEDKEEHVDHWGAVESCLEQATKDASFPTKSLPQPVIAKTLVDEDEDLTLLFEIESAISPYQAAVVKSLALCIRKHVPGFFQHRPFGEDGGNDATFLYPISGLFVPELTKLVQETTEMAFSKSNWAEKGHPPPGTCGIRSSEYLDYRGFKNLGVHSDSGSLYTALFALSDDYKGGHFYIQESSGETHYFKPKRYSCLVFLSETPHGVTDIHSGHREMFTNEYWTFDDPPWPKTRPVLEQMELFTERRQNSTSGDSPLDVDWPTYPEIGEWLIENGREGMADGVYQGSEYWFGDDIDRYGDGENEEDDDDEEEYSDDEEEDESGEL